MYFDPLYLLLFLGTMALSVYASWRVKSAYARYSQVPARSGLSGAQIAQRILDINGIRDDNRIENLRACSRRENLLNSVVSKRAKIRHLPNVKPTDSGYSGVISFGGQNRYLGTYNTEEEAAAAVNGALYLIKVL